MMQSIQNANTELLQLMLTLEDKKITKLILEYDKTALFCLGNKNQSLVLQQQLLSLLLKGKQLFRIFRRNQLSDRLIHI
ncbi:MAG: hypothetical protein ACFC03_03150 [Candidatus Malihini olakiniferum]